LNLGLREFVDQFGKPFSENLGIDLKSGKSEEACKWFLASILYSKPIRESSATNTYRIFESYDITTVSRIVDAGWDVLVTDLDEGGYTRYDFSTATRLLEVFGNLLKWYGGDLNQLHALSKDSRDLENRLKELGKGIGNTTVSIFLRDMRVAWPKADPEPSSLVKLAMSKLKIRDLKRFAKAKHLDLVRLETALLRLGKDFIRKGKRVRIDVSK
jgi:hypothetical protein